MIGTTKIVVTINDNIPPIIDGELLLSSKDSTNNIKITLILFQGTIES
jgi:hypothetical protein